MAAGVLAFGLLFVVLGAYQLSQHGRRRRDWAVYPGRVVGSRLDDGQLRCQIGYVHEGREITFWNRTTATALADPVGREVQVLVNPADPNDAVVSGGLATGATVGGAFIGFGLVALTVGLVLLT